LLLLPSITVSNGESFFDCKFSCSTFFSCTFPVIGNSFCFFSSFLAAELVYYFFNAVSSFFDTVYLAGEETTSTFFTSTDAALAIGTSLTAYEAFAGD